MSRVVALLAVAFTAIAVTAADSGSAAIAQGITARCKVDVRPGQSCPEAIREAEQKTAGSDQRDTASGRTGGGTEQKPPPRRPVFAFPTERSGIQVKPVEVPQRATESGQSPSASTSSSTSTTAMPPPDVINRVLSRKLSPEKVQQLESQLGALGGATGAAMGAPNADRWFDQARPGPGIDTVTQPRRDTIFRGRPEPPPPVTGGIRPVTPSEADGIRHKFGTIPGGVVIQGTATGLGRVTNVTYDGLINAIVLDDRAVYFFPIPSRSVAVLARALAQDDRIGVSLGQMHLLYGAVPPDSELALDLKLADHFLGDIVFAKRDWSAGYRFANGYEPRSQTTASNVAVFFDFNGFEFRVTQEEVRLARANFDVRIIPLSATKSIDGGHLPDFDAISSGGGFERYEENARHVGENIAYYRREKIVEQIFAYGEVAALLRGLKAAGFNLRTLANAVDWSTGIGPARNGDVNPDVGEMRQPIDNLFDAWRRLDLAFYLAQWAPDAIKYIKNKPTRYADIRRSRADLFARIDAVAVNYAPVYRGFEGGLGEFESSYTMAIRLKTGRIIVENECESYQVGRRGGRWVIVENRDYRPCAEINADLRADFTKRQARMEDDWADYLQQIQDHDYYMNWSGPPYDLYRQRHGRH